MIDKYAANENLCLLQKIIKPYTNPKIVKGFYALTIFAERLRPGCLTGL